MKHRMAGALAVVGLVAFLIAGTATPAFAAGVSATVGSLSFTADDSDVGAGATVYDSGSAADITIPSTVMLGTPAQRYAVTQIAQLGFANATLRSVTIPDSVTSIGEQAFVGDQLTTVTIPNSVTNIGEGAFSETTLASVTLGNSVASIGDSAFEFDTSLASITIPHSVTSIGQQAFVGDPLTSVTIPDSVTSVGDYAFNADHLTSISLPNSLTTIGTGVFYGNDLTSVTIPDTVTTIGYAAFRSNDLTSVTIPGSVTTLDDFAFFDNPGLTRVDFTGAAPTTITSRTDPAGPSLGQIDGLTVYYNWAFDAARAADGFSTPFWQGYASAELVTVSFNPNGHGSATAPQDVAVGTAATQPADPSAVGLTFTGWYTSPALTTKADFTDPITTNTTLYAGWTGLAVTGVNINPLTLPLTAGALVIGLVLILITALRRRRS